MKISVLLNGEPQTATVALATESDLAFVAEWQMDLGTDKNPSRVDAVDFAWIAAQRYKTHSTIESYATSINDIADHVKANPKCEVACCALLTCDWFPPSKVIGIAHFRRTWSNNVVLDYLAMHPFITKPPVDYAHKVNGGGLALIYFVSRIARDYDCALLWGEATALSCARKPLRLVSKITYCTAAYSSLKLRLLRKQVRFALDHL